ncbi:hypothetical protein DFA_09632 [Cavenderia fasciculata]|uniref:Uncharacterized protein n=1 Tax=Cavenderia fasciculata TaxID=261658 RepID=F4Q861_CACFS|nr:uncharacterized protein DFA_09632 [Cavenderia fasciculata]EGG15961.1 hypothetical protein DFA_09632 [Cavenderia fasciculata]|eukprot:XP_004352286.1 hypothetical protein DFA_09632 [Cavenderia fasciculata]
MQRTTSMLYTFECNPTTLTTTSYVYMECINNNNQNNNNRNNNSNNNLSHLGPSLTLRLDPTIHASSPPLYIDIKDSLPTNYNYTHHRSSISGADEIKEKDKDRERGGGGGGKDRDGREKERESLLLQTEETKEKRTVPFRLSSFPSLIRSISWLSIFNKIAHASYHHKN